MDRKKLLKATTVIFFCSFFTLFALDEITEHNIFRADEVLRRYINTDVLEIDKPLITNIISFYSPLLNYNNFYRYYYNFIWNENEVKSTFWFITYIDSITRTNILSVGSTVLLEPQGIFECYIHPIIECPNNMAT